jgi:integrase
MPRRKLPPQYLRSKRRPQGGHYARTVIDGREVGLGIHGTPESLQLYEQYRAEWLARQSQSTPAAVPAGVLVTVEEVCLRYLDHCSKVRVKPDGQPKAEAKAFLAGLRPLCRLYGRLPAAEFGPKQLEAVQRGMASGSWLDRVELHGRRRANGGRWCLRVVNRHIVRIRTVWRWAEKEGLVPRGSYHHLQTVRGLTPDEALEHDEVPPVPEDLLQATIPHLGPVVRDIVQVQLLTGARPSEVLQLRPQDLERADRVEIARGIWVTTGGRVWVYRPREHKTAHRGRRHRRVILVGPQAQEVLRPYLEDREPGQYLFSPLEADLIWHREAGRKVPEKGSRQPGERYTADSYRRAVTRACDRASPPPAALVQRLRAARSGGAAAVEAVKAELAEWRSAKRWHPYQLRHNAATRLAQQFGWDVARIVLGHRHVDTTRIYALDDLEKAARAMGEVG